jgi:hypothetical protein
MEYLFYDLLRVGPKSIEFYEMPIIGITQNYFTAYFNP